MSELNLKEKILVIAICILVVAGIVFGEFMFLNIQSKIDSYRIKKIQENLGQNIVVTLEK